MCAHDGPATAVACGMNGLVLSGGADHTVRAWHVTEHAIIPIARLTGVSGTVTDIAVAHSGRWAVASQLGGGLVFWRLEELAPLRDAALADESANRYDKRAPPTDLPAIEPALICTGTNTTWSCATTRDGRWLATGSADGHLRYWRVRARRHRQQRGDVHHDRRVEHVMADTRIGADVVGDSLILTLVADIAAHDDAVRAVAVTPDGALLATAGQDESLQLHQVDVLEAGGLANDDDDDSQAARPIAQLRFLESRGGDRDTLASLAFKSDGSALLAAGWDGCLYDYTIYRHRGQPELSHSGQRRFVARNGLWTVAVSADGAYVAAGGETGRIRVDGHQLDVNQTTLRHGDLVWDLAFAPDAAWLMSASVDGTLLRSQLRLSRDGYVLIAGSALLGEAVESELASQPGAFQHERLRELSAQDAIRALNNDELDVFISPRALGISDLSGGAAEHVVEVPLGHDALAVIANTRNGWLESISIEELAQLLSSRHALKWHDLRDAWPTRRVQIVLSTSNSPLGVVAAALLEDDQRLDTSRAYDLNSQRKVAETVAEMLLDSVGIVSLATAQSVEGVRIVPVDFGAGAVMPDRESIASGGYERMTYPLFMYVNHVTAVKPGVWTVVHLLHNGPAGADDRSDQDDGSAHDETTDKPPTDRTAGLIPLSDVIWRRALAHLRHRIVGPRYALAPDLESAYQDPADFAD